MAACSHMSPSRQIDTMQKRLNKAENRLEVIYNEDFNSLVTDCLALDSTMLKTAENIDAYNLIMMYLQQFELINPQMHDDIEFSRQQLSDLKDDLTSGVLQEDKVLTYIAEEESILKIIEARVNYFQEKFDEQKKVAKELAK